MSDPKFPLNRLLLLGALMGVGAYAFSRRRTRSVPDQHFSAPGLRAATEEMDDHVTQGSGKTQAAAVSARLVTPDPATEVKDATTEAMGEAEVGTDDLKEAVIQALIHSRNAPHEVAVTVQDQDIKGEVSATGTGAQLAAHSMQDHV